MASILTLQSGQPLTAVLATALSGTQSNGTDRPDLIANPDLPGGQRDPRPLVQYQRLRRPSPLLLTRRGLTASPATKGAT